MTEKTDFTVLSSDGKTMLHGIAWVPEGEVRAVVQLAHGITEHIGRYDDFARYLNEHGIALYGHDHLGHGLSATIADGPADFGEGNTWHTAVNDLYVLHTRLKREYPHVPHIMAGYSMGSFMARTYLIRYPGTVQGAILVGTAWVTRAKLTGGLAALDVLAKKDEHMAGETIDKLAFGSYNKHFKPVRTGHDWLSADPDWVDSFEADALCRQGATVGILRRMMQGIRFNQKYDNLDKMDKTTPVLFLSGNMDPVGDMGAGVRQTCHEFRRSGMQDCTVKFYAGKRHDLLQEKDARETVFADVWKWIEEKIV